MYIFAYTHIYYTSSTCLWSCYIFSLIYMYVCINNEHTKTLKYVRVQRIYVFVSLVYILYTFLMFIIWCIFKLIKVVDISMHSNLLKSNMSSFNGNKSAISTCSDKVTQMYTRRNVLMQNTC